MGIAVIGAGPAGLSAALQLARGGADVAVYEAAGAVGGLSRTLDLWGAKADLGPHAWFGGEERVDRLWREFAGDDVLMLERRTRIYYRRRFFSYPIRPANALRNMGPLDAARCVASYAAARLNPRPGRCDSDFEAWMVSRFGRRLFEMFFRSYSEKLWGLGCAELDAEFARQRIRSFSLAEALRGAFGVGHAGAHRTGGESLLYPSGGAGLVYERMAKALVEAGGSLRLNAPVRRVMVRDGRVAGVELDSGERALADTVVSTMPVTELARGLGPAPADVERAVAALSYRNTVLVYLQHDGESESLFNDHWLYVHSPELGMGRVTNFANWRPGGGAVLALEYWCSDRDELWREDDAKLISRARAEIASTGLAGAGRVGQGRVVRLARSYPVYAKGYREHVERIATHLASVRGLVAIGRNGSFKYNNQDHSILMGVMCAENILADAGHDLWSVNSDYERGGR